jgi:hypothetical protein
MFLLSSIKHVKITEYLKLNLNPNTNAASFSIKVTAEEAEKA